MPDIEVRISGGIFLLSLTYWSNCVSSARRIASTSCGWPGSPASGCASARQVLAQVGRRSRCARAACLRPAPSRCRRAASASAAPSRCCRSRRGPRRAGSSFAACFCATSRMCLPGVHRGVERLDRLRPPDEQRDDHVREHDDVAQRQQRQRGHVGGADWGISSHREVPFRGLVREHGVTPGGASNGLGPAYQTGPSPIRR